MSQKDNLEITEEDALAITAETLLHLLQKGINTATLTTDDNMVIKVDITVISQKA